MPEITIKLTEEQLKFLTDYGQWSGLGSPEEVVIKTIFSSGRACCRKTAEFFVGRWTESIRSLTEGLRRERLERETSGKKL